MRRQELTVLSTIVIVSLFLPATVRAVGGDMGVGTEPLTDGSEAYPYLIEDLADFDTFAGDPAYWAAGVHTKLTTDIDLSGRTYTTAVIAPDTDDISNGFQGTQFTGVFDGGGCTITNLTITAPAKDFIGLFGYIVPGGHIKNLDVINVNVQGDYGAGGLAGINYGTISSCSANGAVIGTGQFATVGGLAGYNNGNVSSCYASGSVNGNWFIGGLVGYNDNNGNVLACYASGVITGTDAGTTVGGLVGGNNSNVTNCYASGSVNSGKFVGGLLGDNYGSVSNCYASGTVSGILYVGGLVGSNPGSFSTCFWDTQMSGTTVGVGDRTATGMIGKTTAEMMAQSTFTGWDFSTPIWVIEEGVSYPHLWWEIVPGPMDLVVELAENMNGLELPAGIENGLQVKLDGALKALEDDNENNDGAAINSLQAFINAVNAQRGKAIFEEDADSLIATARQIIDMLSNQ